MIASLFVLISRSLQKKKKKKKTVLDNTRGYISLSEVESNYNETAYIQTNRSKIVSFEWKLAEKCS